MAFQHKSVAFGFRKNARRRNSLKTRVPLDLALVRYAGVGFEAVAVNEQVLGGWFKGRNGSVHGQIRSLQDVARVNFLGASHTNGPMSGWQ